jgi:hypothetical protein
MLKSFLKLSSSFQNAQYIILSLVTLGCNAHQSFLLLPLVNIQGSLLKEWVGKLCVYVYLHLKLLGYFDKHNTIQWKNQKPNHEVCHHTVV